MKLPACWKEKLNAVCPVGKVIKLFDIFDLGWVEGAEGALIFAALTDGCSNVKCHRYHSILIRLKDGRYLCKKCKSLYVKGDRK